MSRVGFSVGLFEHEKSTLQLHARMNQVSIPVAEYTFEDAEVADQNFLEDFFRQTSPRGEASNSEDDEDDDDTPDAPTVPSGEALPTSRPVRQITAAGIMLIKPTAVERYDLFGRVVKRLNMAPSGGAIGDLQIIHGVGTSVLGLGRVVVCTTSVSTCSSLAQL